MKRFKLTKSEKAIENALLRGEYVPAPAHELKLVADAIAARRKDAVLNIRINSQDLNHLKQKAKTLGVPYQTFISEILHHYAG
ncbi:MAG: CopG family antitoxin [Elusimicrobiota bacterium]|nr:CopG family antitoxin [Elusimicrobiota bacterium]